MPTYTYDHIHLRTRDPQGAQVNGVVGVGRHCSLVTAAGKSLVFSYKKT